MIHTQHTTLIIHNLKDFVWLKYTKKCLKKQNIYLNKKKRILLSCIIFKLIK